MPSIQSLGVGSGLDVNSIIAQLMSIERQPLARLQKAASGVQSEISVFASIKSKLDALETAVGKLGNPGTFTKTTVDAKGSSAVSVTALSSADPTELELSISNLATRQSIETMVFSEGSTKVFGAGTLEISAGSWSAAFGAFTPGAAAPESISISDPAATLEDVRDAINAQSTRVTASLLNDGSGTRLVLQSSQTGATSGFAVTDSTGSEYAALRFESQVPTATSSGAKGNTVAQSLTATLNGSTITSASNTLNNVLDGVTIQALQTTAAPVSVSIKRDVADIKTKIQDFVSAYNGLISYVREQTAYNDATKTGGTLQGDRLAVTLQGQLRNTAVGTSGASATFARLSELGISLQKDGSLSVNGGKLDDALANNLDSLATFFSKDDALAANDGLATRFSDLIDGLTGLDGALTSKQESLRKRLTRNQADQDRFNDRLALIEKRLTAQYSALDTRMSTLSGLSQYVSQQVQLLNKSQGG